MSFYLFICYQITDFSLQLITISRKNSRKDLLLIFSKGIFQLQFTCFLLIYRLYYYITVFDKTTNKRDICLTNVREKKCSMGKYFLPSAP